MSKNTSSKLFNVPGFKDIYVMDVSGNVYRADTNQQMTVEYAGKESARVKLSKDGVRTWFRVTDLLKKLNRSLSRTKSRSSK